jgi:N-methylhydantoinase A
LIGGGGAAGFNSVWIARRLGCPLLVVPETGAALSAAGALMSELREEVRELHFTTSATWDGAKVNDVLGRLEAHCRAFAARNGAAQTARIEFAVEARYEGQVWEIEVPLPAARFGGPETLAALVADFHAHHEEIFAVRDEGSAVEFVSWTASVACPLHHKDPGRLTSPRTGHTVAARRMAYFADVGAVETPVHELFALPHGETRQGPAIVETPFTTIVVDPKATYTHAPSGSLIIKP